METAQPATAGTCPAWCVIDHDALVMPSRPRLGTIKSHIGPDYEVGGTRVHASCWPGGEPEIGIYNYLDEISIHLSVGEANDLLRLIGWLARGGTSTAREFASAVGEALETIQEDPEDDPRGDDRR